MACNPYEPGFAACSGLPTEPRLNPYGPGLPTPPPARPFAPLVEMPVAEAWMSRVEDELALTPARDVSEPAPVLLLAIAVMLVVRRWSLR
jgi:hypothetical protein